MLQSHLRLQISFWNKGLSQAEWYTKLLSNTACGDSLNDPLQMYLAGKMQADCQ